MSKWALLLVPCLSFAENSSTTATTATNLWRSSLDAAIARHPVQAEKQLVRLKESKSRLISPNRLNMTLARVLYQKKDFSGAIRHYTMVARDSDEWLEALEEKAWAYLRLNQPGKALTELQTALAPIFTPQVGPEPYFLASYINLKTCNFGEVFTVLKNFKARFRDRIEALQLLANSGSSSASETLLEKIGLGPLTARSIGRDAHVLPRLFWRDRTVMANWRARDSAGFSARMALLAKNDLGEISRVLAQLQLVEAEAIQRAHLGGGRVPPVKTAASTPPRVPRDQVTFPYTGEVWLDELDHYRVNVQGCGRLGKKKL